MQIKNQIKGWLKRVAAASVGVVMSVSAIAATDTVTYFHNDISGTPMVATNAAGQVVWKETYRPFGEKLTNSAAASNNKVGYAGKPFDSNTGLSYMGARYYDPVLGRFTGVDPKEVNPNDLHSFNRYAYANNNPYKYVDPDGRAAALVILPMLGWAASGAIISGGFNALTQLGTAGQVRWSGVGGVIDAAGDGAILGPMFAGVAARSADSAVGGGIVNSAKGAMARGRDSEARVLNDLGLSKNTQKVTTAEGAAIPDALTASRSIEIKDTICVSCTRQIRIETEAAKASGRESVLVTGEKTRVTPQTERAFDRIIRRDDLGPQQ